MFAKLPRKIVLVSILAAVIVVAMVASAIPAMAATPGNTTTTTISTTPPDKFSRPTVTGVSPSEGNQGETLSVTISGTNFTGATKVFFGRNIKVSDFKVTSSTTITADIEIGKHAPAGARIVAVGNPSGRGALKDGFTVISSRPKVTGVSPSEGNQGETLSVTISGTNFTGATKVFFGRNIKVSDFKVTGSTTITADIEIGKHAPAGARIVAVGNPSGKGALKDGFNVAKSELTMPTTKN